MTRKRLTRQAAGAANTVWVMAATLVLAGCASPQPDAAPFRDNTMSIETAQTRVATGQSTKADVWAALGPATVVPFDSGFEVWVYRSAASRRGGAAPAELVLLFNPEGRLAKTRVRPGDGARID